VRKYTNPNKFLWICPSCGDHKTSGGSGHINAQACGHMRNEHKEECLIVINGVLGYDFGQFIKTGLDLGVKHRSSKSGVKNNG